MPMDLDRLDFDKTITEDSQRSTLSPHDSQMSIGGSQHTIGGLVIPPSFSSSVGGPVGGFGSLSIRGDSGAGSRFAEPARVLDLDPAFEVLEDGTMRMSEAPLRQPAGPRAVGERLNLGSVGSGVRAEQFGPANDDGFVPLEDDAFVPLQDDYDVNALDQPLATPTAAGQAQQQSTTAETADAPVRRRARPAAKTLPVDNTIELRNGDLARWGTEYTANMNEALRHKEAGRLAALAKKNAEYFVLGSGIVPFGISDQGPLSMFTGARLLEAFAGLAFATGVEKRGRAGDDEEDFTARKRSRGPGLSSDEIGRGFQDDDLMPMMGDEMEIEHGREQQTPLDDRHLSSNFPWNQSGISRRPTDTFNADAGQMPTSGSLGGAVGFFSRRGSRLVSASPLMGRGVPIASDLDEIEVPGLHGDTGMTGADEFELFGPAAQVDTQTAAHSQWQRTILDSESLNFLSFVQAGIEERDQARQQAVIGDEDGQPLTGSIDFEVLLPPQNNSNIVAAQALLQLLALGTKNLLAVEQIKEFGPISMKVIATQ